MENNMDGAVGVEEQYSWMVIKFVDVLVKNKDIGMKIDETQERILALKNEQAKMLYRHEKISEASNLLEVLCVSFLTANKQLREGSLAEIKKAWDQRKAASGNPDGGSPMSVLVDRMRNISIETDANKEVAQGVSSGHQQEDRRNEAKWLLSAEMALGLQFFPVLAVLEEDLINQNKLLRLERSQLEEKVKRTLSTFARIKLDLSGYEDECRRLQNILQKCTSTLWAPVKTEINKMAFDLKEIEMNNTAMFRQWQAHHNILCEILDDVRIFNTQAIKGGEKICQLCKICKQLNAERLELVNHFLGIIDKDRNTSLGKKK
ncbi:uncharacterized protein LOC126184915 [Schistocerca cancellata]|uniref:uncharacterized protein LOC126184915 n=1 Tax=Schistocerca cancellata TaxID=274614 RepID=UPI00211876B6|nr:uncharacterized protein LOC126184915 [Schistocerca cancellata]